MIATSQFTISVVNDGQTGSQGVSVVSTYPEWRLSDASNNLIPPDDQVSGSGTPYHWSTTKPSVPAGKYIWERTVTVLSNNTTVESNPVCDIVMSGVIFDVDANTQAITNKVWSSDISTAINTYDGSTAQSIRDNVSQLTTDLSGITTRVGAAETAITTKADGSTVTTLSNDYSAFKQTMSGFKTTVESDYAQLTDLDNLKVSGNNLYVIKDSVPGYLHASNGSIKTQSSTYKEYTSDYIPVVSGSTYIIQSWATPTTTGVSWLAYQFFTDASAANAIGNRTDKYGSDTGSGVDTTAEGMEHLMYKVEAPSTANYLRVSFRAFSDGYCMVEQATMPSEYSVSYKDVNSDISSVRTVAEQTADQFSWIVADGSSSSSVTYTSNALTAMANQIDLTGKVTFNSMDSTLQDRVTTVETNASTALKGMKVYSGTCSTTTDTAEKAVTCSDTDFDLTNGTIITVTFSTASTANAPTLNVNSKGAKAIYFDNAVTSSTNKFRWQAGSVITFQYNGTYWIVLNYQNLDYFTCSTTASTTAKATTSVTGTFVLCKGTTVTVFFDTSNSADAPTLNIGSTGAFAIYYKNAVTSSSNKYLWVANTTVNFTFNGSYWYVNDGGAQLARDYAKSAVDWVSTNGADVLTDKSILDSWKGQAVSGTTTINGGLIQTHTIESQHLATDAIMSSNYDSGTQNQEVPSYNASTNPFHFSTAGTFLDLANGNLYSPNFSVINTVPTGSSVSVGAYISGHINATSGTIGGCNIVNGTLKIAEANIDGTLSANVINASTLSIGMSQVTDLSTTLAEAAKTATNYLYFDSNNGLVISQTGVVGTGYNTQITNSGMNIRSGTTTLASYGSTITLGEIANGVTRVQIDNDSLDIISRDSNSVDTTFATFGINGIVLGDNSGTYLSIDNDSFNINVKIGNTSSEIVHIGNYDVVEVVESIYGDGVQTQFTLKNQISSIIYISKKVLDEERSDQQTQVYVIVYLVEGEDFTFSGDTITFSQPIPSYSDNQYLGSYLVRYYRPFNAPIYTFGTRQIISDYDNGGIGEYSTTFGTGNIAAGYSSVSEGHDSKAFGRYSHAQGYGTEASGRSSHGEGELTKALSYCSHAEGYCTKAYYDDSSVTIAAAHAEGDSCQAYGNGAHAEGLDTLAYGWYSHAQNLGTIANRGQTAIGRYNVEDLIDDQYYPWGHYAFIIGNGYDDARSNAFAVGWDGSIKANNTLIYSPTADCAISHVGMIIMSTKLNTMEKVIAIYGGTTWIQHSGYMLRGASSGVTGGSGHNVSDGGVENVTLTKAQCALPEHGHGVYYKRANITANNSGNTHILCHSSNTGATNWPASNANASGAVQKNHIDNATSSHTNMPPYKNVYIWERTA